MGFFKSDDHLFAFYEKKTIDRKFINILKTAKVKSIEFIDQYEGEQIGEGKKSVSFKMLLGDPNRTLTAKNAEKVAKIKAAIEQGNYPIDARKVAESFASLERMIGGE